MVEESIYEGKDDQMFDDIKNGAGWASYDYVLNAKHSPLSKKDRVRLLIRLAKAGILADEDLMSGKEQHLKQISPKALMSLQDLEKKYKGRTNPAVNEGVKIKQDWNKVKNIPKDDILVSVDGKDYTVAFNSDTLGEDPYGIGFPGEDQYDFITRSRRAKAFWKKYRTVVLKWKQKNTNESVNEAKFGYKDGTSSYMKNHKDEYKDALKINKTVGKDEMKFYDVLEVKHDKVGHPKYMIFLANALRGFNVDMYKDPKIKNRAEAEEALYILSK